MKKITLIGFIALLLSGCGENSVKQAIEANGFTEVQTSSSINWFGCGKDDSIFYNTNFVARSVNGKTVEGVACGGMLKGWTVRIEKIR